MMMEDKPGYQVNLQWNYDIKGTLSAPVLSDEIEGTCMKGKEEKWSSEHLVVAAVNSYLMATFLSITDHSDIEFISFQSNAIGKVENVDGEYVVTEIVIEPKLVLSSSVNEERIRRIFEISEQACAISNSIKSKINLVPIILLQ